MVPPYDLKMPVLLFQAVKMFSWSWMLLKYALAVPAVLGDETKENEVPESPKEATFSNVSVVDL
jgi:hypothetical protein